MLSLTTIFITQVHPIKDTAQEHTVNSANTLQFHQNNKYRTDNFLKESYVGLALEKQHSLTSHLI